MVNHTVRLVPLYQFTNSRLYVPVSFNYSDLGYDKYYTSFLATPTYLYLLNPSWGVEVGGQLARKYFWFPVTVPEDNRSGRNVGGSLGLYRFLKNQEGSLSVRVIYEHDFAEGSNWENSNYRLVLAALIPITPRLKVTTFLDMSLQPYNFQNVSLNQFGVLVHNAKRRDKNLVYGVAGAYEIYKNVEFNLHYFLVRDDSNLALFNYWRHVVGCQIGYRY
jgi:hypothetical protein